MKRMIPIVNAATGTLCTRPSTTATLDLPPDFDRAAPIAELDGKSRVRYLSLEGKSVVRPTQPRPLSWRVHGEECLVSDGAAAPSAAQPGNFTLFVVE